MSNHGPIRFESVIRPRRRAGESPAKWETHAPGADQRGELCARCQGHWYVTNGCGVAGYRILLGLKVGVFRSGSWAFQNRTWSRNSRRTVPLKVRVEGMGRRHKRSGLVSWTPNVPKTRGPALYLEHRVMISLNVGAYAAHESQTLLGAPRWSNPGPDGLARRARRRPRELWRDRPERVRDRSCEEVEARGYDLQGHRNQHSQLNRGSA
jgi:hypothetical protein